MSGFGSQVTDEQLRRYADLIYRRTGIRISPQKKTLLSNRLRRRLRETGIKGYDEYYQHLTSLKPDDPEWDGFLQEITTHETYLFRDEAQWAWFRKQFLPEMEARAKKTGRRQLKIWSAACSTGDEAMTIATCIAASLPNFQRWNIRILGTDIGIGAVEQAKTAVFNERAMKLVPEELRKRYFTQVPNASVWKAKPVLTSMAVFRQHNLLDPLVNEGPFDIVFLKNVLIYFDTESKKRVIDNVTKVLREGGYLVAGAAEGISGLVRSYQRLHPWLYRVPETKEKSSSPTKKTTYSFLKK
ncbi:MAG: protein-glutamate O-methyltransferase CheR [Planctomycetota bacterium]|nr:MAG: protein-glutamate O-methyltransferase CheR [Planctomycetota bacterium]